ncbi:hypothetical protein KY290_010549 [Solanum tuberosum]|uniref:Uncharacterized protein n=1 Tax=Solanum tuberosum TaxID=4113 RepID=A0ABQ7VY38_SOLTU|nr:hypothetical protein KY290_010549 [Solanum tuberosum]
MPNTRSKGASLIPYDPKVSKTIRKMVLKKNEGVDEIVPHQHQPKAPRGKPQELAHIIFEKDDLELDGVGSTGAIVLTMLPP